MASQTVPILAIAPLVVVALKADWLSVTAVATYLTFFPVTIASLRGLRAVDPRALELYPLVRGVATPGPLAAPAADVGAVPVLRRSGWPPRPSVIGAIIGEQPAGVADGLGSAILNYNQYYVTAPERLWVDDRHVHVRRARLRRHRHASPSGCLTRGRYRPVDAQ